MKLKNRTFIKRDRYGYPPTFHELPYETFIDMIKDMRKAGFKVLNYTDTRALFEKNGYIRYVTLCK